MADEDEEYDAFVKIHRVQLEISRLPVHHWRPLYEKLKNETYDAGSYFTMVQDDDEGLKVVVSAVEGIQASDADCVFLIDHAWTYQVNYARAQLRAVPGLADRMASLMGLTKPEVNKHEKGDDNKEDTEHFNGEESDLSNGKEESLDQVDEQLVNQIFDKMWSFNQTYHLKVMGYSKDQVFEKVSDNDDEHIPLWFIMDEFGSCIRHSDEPSFGLFSFYYVPLGVSFSVLWPLRDVGYGEDVSRDYIPGVKDSLSRDICLLPWFSDKLTDSDWINKLSAEVAVESVKNELSTFQEQDWQGEVFPKSTGDIGSTDASSSDDGKIYRVYTTVPQVTDFLTHSRFVLVDNKEDADVLWLREHFKDFRSVQESGKFINQFPNECTVTCKDLLAAVCHKAAPSEQGDLLRRGPEWLPVTFNLNLELPLFLHHYLKRMERGLDNHWICKPWNLARALDTHITSNLDYLIRLRESGPKVACKYIENPVLFRREDVGLVKFDFRYLVLLTSAKPLILHADKVFWLRFANQPFSMDSFDSYAKHFTVMNYKDSETLKQVHHDEFIPMFEEQYPDHKWADIEAKILKMFRELFEAAVSDSPPKCLIHCSQSRSFYAVDLMIKWADDGSNDMVPQLLELNYGPDCERACRYHPNFFNFIFSLLFLGDANGWPVEKL